MFAIRLYTLLRRSGRHRALEVNDLIAAAFIRDRDILVVSERGTWFSQPALTCAASDDFARELLGLRFYSEATKRAPNLASTEACHGASSLATGANLSAYNSTESAADLADLPAKGFSTLPCGISTGPRTASYLAQTLKCATTQRASAASSSISVLPTTYTVAAANWWNARNAFDNLFQACAAQPACNAAHPRLQETLRGWSTGSRPSR